MTLPGDVNHPESQEVLVSNEVCLQFGNGCLSGAGIAPFSSGCLRLPSLVGDGLVRSRLALLSPLFCELAWQCLRLGLFTGIVLSLSLSLSLFTSLALPQFGLLSQVSSLRLPFRAFGPVLTLSNAACGSLFSPCLLVVSVSTGSCY